MNQWSSKVINNIFVNSNLGNGNIDLILNCSLKKVPSKKSNQQSFQLHSK